MLRSCSRFVSGCACRSVPLVVWLTTAIALRGQALQALLTLCHKSEFTEKVLSDGLLPHLLYLVMFMDLDGDADRRRLAETAVKVMAAVVAESLVARTWCVMAFYL